MGPLRAKRVRRHEQIGREGVAISVVRPKLRVGAVDDPAEREADQLADEVSRWLSAGARAEDGGEVSAVNRLPLPGVSRVRRMAAPNPAGAEGGPVGATLEQDINRARRSGAPLPEGTRAEMGGAFGADFSRVRIHTGTEADSLNRSIGARAFTVDQDVFFAGNEYQPGTDGGRHLLAHELAHTLQQSAPVSRVVRRAESETAEEETTEPTEPAAEAEVEGDETEGEERTITGSIPESEFGHTEAMSTAPPAGMQTDGLAASTRSARSSSPRGSEEGDGFVVQLGQLAVSASDKKVATVPKDADADNVVKASATTTGTTAGGGTVTPFGGCSHGFNWSVPTFTVADKKKNKVITINVSVTNTNTWGTNSGGNIDVPSGSDGVVTADTYAQIVTDLTPKKQEKSWVAPRSTYWSQAICERHEKYHARDATTWTQGQGKKFIDNYLKKKKIAITSTDLGNNGAGANLKIATAVNDAKSALVQAFILYMRGTSGSYYSYPCEEKAFGDGKAPYQKLASAVKTRGKALEKQKRDAEKKAAKASAKTTAGSDGTTTDDTSGGSTPSTGETTT